MRSLFSSFATGDGDDAANRHVSAHLCVTIHALLLAGVPYLPIPRLAVVTGLLRTALIMVFNVIESVELELAVRHYKVGTSLASTDG